MKVLSVSLAFILLLSLFNAATAQFPTSTRTTTDFTIDPGPIPGLAIGLVIALWVIGSLITCFLIILDILCIVQILRSPLDSNQQILYILLILFFPLVGICVWCIVGKRGY